MNELTFEFGKYTEVTELAHKVNPSYKQGANYTRIFLCTDTWDFWLCRIHPDINEDYGKEPGTFLLERDKIGKDSKSEVLTVKKATEILENDSFENWDTASAESEEELIEMIDGGFGILNLIKS